MKNFSTRSWVIMAMMTAASIILSRFFKIETYITRTSLGYIPIILTGILLGPLPGIIVGLVADFLGTVLFSALAWFPPLALTPMFIGLWSGVMKKFILKNKFLPTILIIFAGNIVGRIIISGICLSYLQGTELMATLSIRIPFGIIMTVIDSVVIYLLLKSPITKIYRTKEHQP